MYDYAMQRQRIASEVRIAHARLVKAASTIGLWRKGVVDSLADAAAQAEVSYASGDISYLFVLETSRRLLEARLQEVDIVAEGLRSLAELERSIGGSLDQSASSNVSSEGL